MIGNSGIYPSVRRTLRNMLRIQGMRAYWFFQSIAGGLEILVLNSFPRPGTNEPGPRTRQLLLVNLQKLGDVVMMRRLIRDLRSCLPEAGVSIVVRKEYADVLGGQDVPDRVVPVDTKRYRRSLPYRLRILADLRSRRFTQAINLHLARSILSDHLTLLSGARTRIGFTGDGLFEASAIYKLVGGLYDHRLPLAGHHVLEIWRRLTVDSALEPLLRKNGGRELADWRSASGRAWRKRRSARGLRIGIVASASTPLKCWPLQRFVELLNRVGNERTTFVLLGSAAERHFLEKLRRWLLYPSEMAAGTYGLKDIWTMMGGLDLLVGNDSGIMHAGAAMGKPVLVIAAAGEPGRFWPYGGAAVVEHSPACAGCRWLCPYTEPHCITSVSVDEVEKPLRNMLERIRGSKGPNDN